MLTIRDPSTRDTCLAGTSDKAEDTKAVSPAMAGLLEHHGDTSSAFWGLCTASGVYASIRLCVCVCACVLVCLCACVLVCLDLDMGPVADRWKGSRSSFDRWLSLDGLPLRLVSASQCCALKSQRSCLRWNAIQNVCLRAIAAATAPLEGCAC